MTTYTYDLTLTDGERTMLEVALKLLMHECQKKVDDGGGAPYVAQKHHAERVLGRLKEAGPQLASTSQLP